MAGFPWTVGGGLTTPAMSSGVMPSWVNPKTPMMGVPPRPGPIMNQQPVQAMPQAQPRPTMPQFQQTMPQQQPQPQVGGMAAQRPVDILRGLLGNSATPAQSQFLNMLSQRGESSSSYNALSGGPATNALRSR